MGGGGHNQILLEERCSITWWVGISELKRCKRRPIFHTSLLINSIWCWSLTIFPSRPPAERDSEYDIHHLYLSATLPTLTQPFPWPKGATIIVYNWILIIYYIINMLLKNIFLRLSLGKKIFYFWLYSKSDSNIFLYLCSPLNLAKVSNYRIEPNKFSDKNLIFK